MVEVLHIKNIGDGYANDVQFKVTKIYLEFFKDIDNLAEPFGDIDGSKIAPKNNLTHFSLHYLFRN